MLTNATHALKQGVGGVEDINKIGVVEGGKPKAGRVQDQPLDLLVLFELGSLQGLRVSGVREVLDQGVTVAGVGRWLGPQFLVPLNVTIGHLLLIIRPHFLFTGEGSTVAQFDIRRVNHA